MKNGKLPSASMMGGKGPSLDASYRSSTSRNRSKSPRKSHYRSTSNDFQSTTTTTYSSPANFANEEAMQKWKELGPLALEEIIRHS